MIKQDMAITEIKGSKLQIESELATLISSIHKNNILTKEELEETFRNGLKTLEELNKEVDEKLEKNIRNVRRRLNETNRMVKNIK